MITELFTAAWEGDVLAAMVIAFGVSMAALVIAVCRA